MSITERLTALRSHFGLSQKAMAARLGIAGNTWQRYELANEPPNSSVLAKLAGEGIDTHWLLTGEGAMLRRQADAGATGFSDLPPSHLAENEIGGSGFVRIPQLRIRTTDDGVRIDDLSLAGALAFSRVWLKTVFETEPGALLSVEMEGEAMEPGLRDGDLLLLDTSQPKLRGSGIYAFRVQGLLTIRRLQMKLDGSVAISSDNPTAGPPESFGPDETASLDIVGKAIWAGGRL